MQARSFTIVATAMLSALVALPAAAQEADSDAWMLLPSPTTRAEFRASQQPPAEADQPKVVGKTRAQVRAELAAARASGEFDRLHAEAYSFDDPAPRSVWLARAPK